METKSMSGKKGIANYLLDRDGSVYLVSVVTEGNWGERYSNRYLKNEGALENWLNS